MDELFRTVALLVQATTTSGDWVRGNVYLSECEVCGSLVRPDRQQSHIEWHEFVEGVPNDESSA